MLTGHVAHHGNLYSILFYVYVMYFIHMRGGCRVTTVTSCLLINTSADRHTGMTVVGQFLESMATVQEI